MRVSQESLQTHPPAAGTQLLVRIFVTIAGVGEHALVQGDKPSLEIAAIRAEANQLDGGRNARRERPGRSDLVRQAGLHGAVLLHGRPAWSIRQWEGRGVEQA